MSGQWGRKETIIWPPQVPIYTYGALILAAPITVVLLWTLFTLKPFLQRNYTGAYLKSSFGSMYQGHGKYGLIYLGGGKQKPRVAGPEDFMPGSTALPNGKMLNVQLSPVAKAEGFTGFFRGQPQKYADNSIHTWLQADVFWGDDLLASYESALIEAAVTVIFMLCFAVPADFKRGKRLKYGRLLRGPVMCTPKEFNQAVEGSGIGIITNEKRTVVRIPILAESKHIQVMGDTGVGKTTLLTQILSQIEERDQSAIIYDPAGEFTQRFYREDRGDYILNPFDERFPYWTPSSELRNAAEARTIAASLYQPTENKKGEFFTETPQKIFAHLMRYRPSAEDLVAWMSNPEEIDKRVEGTELAAMIAQNAPDQRNGVLGSLGLIADGLRLIPRKESKEAREWSATAWSEKREGWIFLSSVEEAQQEALRPLHSLWLDLLILRLLAPAKEGQKRAWFVIDEVATLQRLPQFHTALTKGRKSNNPIIYGYQGKAQLEVIYGHLAEVMLSQPATKIVMKTAEPKAAKWASELIGDIEIERVRETVADGKRAGKSFHMDRQIEPLVMASEIAGLNDLHAFLKLGNNVTRFSFPHMGRALVAPAFVERKIPENEQWLKPLGKKVQDKKPGNKQNKGASKEPIKEPTEELEKEPALDLVEQLAPEEQTSDELMGGTGRGPRLVLAPEPISHGHQHGPI